MTWDEIERWLAELGFAPDDLDDPLDDIDLETDDPWGAIELAHGTLTADQRRFLVEAGIDALLDEDSDDSDDSSRGPSS